MRILLPLVTLSALNIWAQSQSQPSPEVIEKLKAAAQSATAAGKTGAQPDGAPAAPKAAPKTVEVTVPAPAILPITKLPPSMVIATVDGEKVTAGDLQAVLRAMPPQVQQKAESDRRKFVEQYGVLRRLSEEAKKAKLDQQSPWKESIEYGVMQVLYSAEINQKFAEVTVPADEVKKSYDEHKDKYKQVKVKAIYLPFSTAPVSQADSKGKKLLSEAEAKAKADELVKEIRGGADFVKLVKEYSGDPNSAAKDGDFGYIHNTDPIPPELKTAVFSAKPGDIPDPVRQANGFYIFRIEDVGTQPFEEVQAAITNELKNSRFMEWLNALQKSLDIKMEHEVPTGVHAVPSPSASTAPQAK